MAFQSLYRALFRRKEHQQMLFLVRSRHSCLRKKDVSPSRKERFSPRKKSRRKTCRVGYKWADRHEATSPHTNRRVKAQGRKPSAKVGLGSRKGKDIERSLVIIARGVEYVYEFRSSFEQTAIIQLTVSPYHNRRRALYLSQRCKELRLLRDITKSFLRISGHPRRWCVLARRWLEARRPSVHYRLPLFFFFSVYSAILHMRIIMWIRFQRHHGDGAKSHPSSWSQRLRLFFFPVFRSL